MEKKRKGGLKGRRERERLGSTATAAAAAACQEEKETEGDRGRKGCRIALNGPFLYIILHKEKEV